MKKILLSILVIILIFNTGCWDRKEIENRAYVLGVAIDKYPPSPTGQEGEEETPQEEEKKVEKSGIYTGQPKYALTVQIPIVKKASYRTTTRGNVGDSGSSRTWQITEEGNSFLEMLRNMGTRINQTIYLEHMQVIVISEAAAREGLKKIVDFFVRDPEARRRVKIYISSGEAKSVLDVEPRVEDFSSTYLANLAVHSRINGKILEKTDLGETMENIHAGNAFMLSRVEPTKDEIKNAGVALFNSKSFMVGWLDGLELEGVKFIRNLYEGGIVTAENPEYPGSVIVLEVKKVKSRIVPIVNNNEISFKIQLKVKGNYAENENELVYQHLSRDFFEKAEEAFARKIEEICQRSITKIQKEFGTDVFLFNVVLKTKEPALWKQLEDDWETVFPQIKTEVEADVSIKLHGHVK
ncbi:MAG TPA: Ger(x)C family spore germination protein [Clostridia bacterium]|nr:Ger(x)C family spore germination protein [Clostridia bacterium]